MCAGVDTWGEVEVWGESRVQWLVSQLLSKPAVTTSQFGSHCDLTNTCGPIKGKSFTMWTGCSDKSASSSPNHHKWRWNLVCLLREQHLWPLDGYCLLHVGWPGLLLSGCPTDLKVGWLGLYSTCTNHICKACVTQWNQGDSFTDYWSIYLFTWSKVLMPWKPTWVV